MAMVMAITITTEARKLKSKNNIDRVLLYGQKQHLCVGMIYFMMDDSVDEVGDLVSMRTSCGGYRYFKRFLDALISGVSLIILAVPMLSIAIIVYLDDPGKVFFSQYRIGQGYKKFKLYKFRSMRINTPKYLATADVEHPDKYITKVGCFIRKYSLDELPQLFNVFKGDMSLVGPRPLISNEHQIHELRLQYGVYDIKPGITGLAQINGRDTVSPLNKVKWDVKYANNFCFLMDLKILFATFLKVIKAADVVEGYKFDVAKKKRA